jgi:hypothetical protein
LVCYSLLSVLVLLAVFNFNEPLLAVAKQPILKIFFSHTSDTVLHEEYKIRLQFG